MFNDKYGLTKAVLDGIKTQTRRIPKIQPPYKNSEIAFPTDFLSMEKPEKHPLYGAYCWINKDNVHEHTIWIRPQYKTDEVVAVAQSYKNIGYQPTDKTTIIRKNKIEFIEFQKHKGWNNKMYVDPTCMDYFILITNVRIERLQDISDEDCLAEGIIKGKCGSEDTHFMDAYYVPNEIQPYCTPKDAYAKLIDNISSKGTWEKNPYVFVYDFNLIKTLIE